MSTEVEHDGCRDRCDVEVVHAGEVAAARARTPDDGRLARAVELAAMLSNETRIRIVAALAGDPGVPPVRLCVCDIAVVVEASETATSHQLRALRLARIVMQERAGRLVYYRLAEDPLVRGAARALLHGTT
ncbi:MAG: ArsR/SmtB family transcription factor [Myxococcota bacterium]